MVYMGHLLLMCQSPALHASLYLSLFSLELAVSVVQAYVLTLLACTFLKEAATLH